MRPAPRFSPANDKTKKAMAPLLQHDPWFPYQYAEVVRRLRAAGSRKAPKAYVWNIPAGYNCPGAGDCLSRAHRTTGKIKDGPETLWRCFAASIEGMYPATRALVWSNHSATYSLTAPALVRALEAAIPEDAVLIRVHTHGDMRDVRYLLAWLLVARRNPHIRFYAYTKSIHMLNGRTIPWNFPFTVSKGGKYDHLIPVCGLKQAVVVESEKHAARLGLPVDTTDYHAATVANKDFALIIHGTQPKGRKSLEILP